MKTYILYENDEWMVPITEALRNERVPFEKWNLNDMEYISYDTKPPEGIFFNRMSPSAHHRNCDNFVQKTSIVLEWLERYNCSIINGSASWQLETSKMRQYAALNASGIKTPKTIVAFNANGIKKATSDIGFPCMIKHNCGGRGIGVKLLNNTDELAKYLEKGHREESPDGIILIQEYIKSNEPYIIRAEFIGKDFVYAVKVSTEDGYELCPADSCSLEGNFCPASMSTEKFSVIPDFSHPVIKQYKEFLASQAIEIAGIEFIIDPSGNAYTYDVNMNTNYNSKAEKKCGKSANQVLAKFLHSKMNQIKNRDNV